MTAVRTTHATSPRVELRNARQLAGSLLRPFRKALGYALAFALPLIIVIAAAPAYAGMRAKAQVRPPTFEQPLPAAPEHDPAKRTAVVVAGNAATESSDLLAPYEVLATSEAFNVYVVAPERRLTPLIPQPHCCGTLDIVPHYSFAEYDRVIGTAPDLVVVPYIPQASKEDAAVLDWLREAPGDDTVILSICGGAQMVADAGLLNGRQATSHHTMLPVLEKSHPEARWVRGLRFVEDGRFISSAGVTSGVDATLYTLQRFIGREATLETARRVGYPHTRYLDDPTWNLPGNNPAAVVGDRLLVPNSFRWERTDIGMFVYPGVREIELSSVIDTYPRSTSSDVHAVAAERELMRTRHGLDVLPRFDVATAPQVERIVIPGQPDTAVTAPVADWAEARGRTVERIHAGDGYPYDLTFTDMARRETRLVAEYAARWIEYPVTGVTLPGGDWSPALVLRMLTVGGLGMLLWHGVRRVRTRRTA